MHKQRWPSGTSILKTLAYSMRCCRMLDTPSAITSDADLSRRSDPLGPDLLVVLGGPVGVYETEAYPYSADEAAILAARLAARRPTPRASARAQQIARALGADVPMGHKEIGFAPLPH